MLEVQLATGFSTRLWSFVRQLGGLETWPNLKLAFPAVSITLFSTTNRTLQYVSDWLMMCSILLIEWPPTQKLGRSAVGPALLLTD